MKYIFIPSRFANRVYFNGIRTSLGIIRLKDDYAYTIVCSAQWLHSLNSAACNRRGLAVIFKDQSIILHHADFFICERLPPSWWCVR